MRFTKLHGLGNDFLVALETPDTALEPSPDLARRLCHRHTGIGADGLIFGLRPSQPSVIDNEIDMRLFNADGSEAEVSGNGLRCLGLAWARANGLGVGHVTVNTIVGPRPLAINASDDGTTAEVTADMGDPMPGPDVTDDVAEFGALRVATVDMGNPHVVLLLDTLDGIDVAVDGPRLEAGYPDGINVHFATWTDGRVEMAIWERGVGVTAACGSGACAAAAATHKWGLHDGTVEVRMPGGSVTVDIDSRGAAHLTGPAVVIADVEVT